MYECLLLLAHHLPGPRWAPLVAMPAVFAGIATSLLLIFSGISEYVATEYREKVRRRRTPRQVSFPDLFGQMKTDRR